MNQLNLIAVPNGVFTLEEALEDTLIKKLLQQLQATEVTETDKIKAFLTLYQMIDTLAQLHLIYGVFFYLWAAWLHCLCPYH